MKDSLNIVHILRRTGENHDKLAGEIQIHT